VTVFFIHEPSRDYVDLSTAESFGEVEFVFAPTYPASLYPMESHARATEVLQDFDPAKDYLAFCGGDQGSIAICVIALCENDIWSIPWLRWDRRKGYINTYIGDEPSAADRD